jgi:hypothetical protein
MSTPLLTAFSPTRSYGGQPQVDRLRKLAGDPAALEAQLDHRFCARRPASIGPSDAHMATASPLAPGRRDDDLRPFTRKMRVYAQECVDPSYGVANAAILAGMVGMGVANGGYMILLRLLGRQGSSLPVVGFMTLTAFSMILSGASKTFTSHQRDNQDIGLLGPYRDQVTGPQYCRFFFRCGLATTGTNLALLAGTALYARKQIDANALLAVSVVAKSVEACLKGVELGYWNCIKTHLGDADTQRVQRELNRTIVGIETITQAIAFNAATMATYVALADATDAAQALTGTMGALAVGCGILLASNAYFPLLERQLAGRP